jgi:hypothetical protein
LKTLVKYLKNLVDTCSDPLIIEHTQKQIKQIEKIHKDIKKTIYSKCEFTTASLTIDSMFSPDTSMNDCQKSMQAIELLKGNRNLMNSQTISERQSLEAAMQKIVSSPSKDEAVVAPITKRGRKSIVAAERQTIMPDRKSVLRKAKITVEDECGVNTTLAETENLNEKAHRNRKSVMPLKVGAKRKSKAAEKENSFAAPTRVAARASKR